MNKVEYLDKLEVNDIKIKYDKKIYEMNGDEIKTLKDFLILYMIYLDFLNIMYIVMMHL